MPAISELNRKKLELQRLQELEREQMNALASKSTKKKTTSLKSQASPRRSPRTNSVTPKKSTAPSKKKIESKTASGKRTKSKDKTLKEAQQNYPSSTDDLIGLDKPISDFYTNQKLELQTNNSLIDFADNFSSNGDLLNLQEDVIYEEEEQKMTEQDKIGLQENNLPNKNNLMQSDDEFPENESESELFKEDLFSEDKFPKERQFQEQNENQEEITDSDDNIWDKEPVRDKIIHEMEEATMREKQLQSKHHNNYDARIPSNSHNKIDHLENSDEFIVRRKTSIEYLDQDDYFSEDSAYLDTDTDINRCSPTERIRREMKEQNERERELNNIHRTLSQENLFVYHSPKPQESEEENTDDDSGALVQDTRSKIYEEMELLKEREEELRKKRFYHSQQSLDAFEDHNYDDDDYEEEDGKEEIQVSVIDQIKQEMYDLQNREEELQRRRPRYNSFESMRTDASIEANDNLGLSIQPIFGSRDDLVAFFGTAQHEEVSKPTKKTPRSQHAVKIPKAFRKENSYQQPNKQEPRELTQYQLHATKEKSPKRLQIAGKSDAKDVKKRQQQTRDSREPPRQSRETVYGGRQEAKHNAREKNDIRSIFERQTSRKQQQLTNNNKGRKTDEFPNRIQPIAAKWEKRSEEERIKKNRIEMEIRKKKEEYMQLLREKAEIEKQQRLQQQQRIKELEQKEREREILRQKKQGLNALWFSKKPVVTLEENSDYHDEELLFYPSQTKEEKQIAVVTRKETHDEKNTEQLKISKTIKRWEKRIAKQIEE